MCLAQGPQRSDAGEAQNNINLPIENSLFYPCPQVPTLVIESDEEKEEPAPESTFVPVEPASMYMFYIIILHEHKIF